MRRLRTATLWTSIAGVAAVVAYAALAATQILVLNPLAAAPGRTLGEIRTALSGAGESLMPGAVFFILGIGVVLAVGLAVIAIVGRARPEPVAAVFLALLMLGAPGYFVASFGAGMALADTFGIGGADYSPWARPLYVVSALAAIALVAGAVALAVRRGSGSTSAATRTV